MRRALQLAWKGEGRTAPNPPVGAVLVKNGVATGEGFHKKAGGPHAEIVALKKARGAARGADLFLTLEPCCHHGRTPPCTEALIESGVRRVVIGSRDPNPLVSGKGIRRLKSAGIEIVTGVLKSETDSLIEPFTHFMQTGLPFVSLKAAMSLDGKIATAGGESKWITGAQARHFVHQLRNRVDAILVGANTVIQDNPRLSARQGAKRERFPLRVVIDPRQRVPLASQLFQDAGEHPVVSITRPVKNRARRNALERLGVEVVELAGAGNVIPFRKILKILGDKNILHLLIEGGGEVNAHALKAAIVNKVYWFIAPVFIGGKSAPGALGGEGIRKLKDAWHLKNASVQQLGNDFLIEGDL